MSERRALPPSGGAGLGMDPFDLFVPRNRLGHLASSRTGPGTLVKAVRKFPVWRGV